MTDYLVDLSGKNALVTGASSGLGSAIAQRLVEAGVKVAGLGRDSHGLQQTKDKLCQLGGTFLPIEADLSQDGTMEKAVAQTVAELGQLDILINNAGVMFTHQPGETLRSRWSQLLQINLLSVIEGCEAAIKHMRDNQMSGRIVNISSMASRLSGGGVYGASKLGLEKYTQELRGFLEYDNIRAILIVPGGFSTNLGRDLKPEELDAFQQKWGERLLQDKPDADGRSPYFGVADDVARAVMFAIAQPDNINVSELVIRPARNIDPDAFSSLQHSPGA